MTFGSRLRTAASRERGAVLVIFALFAPVAILFLSFSIDIGNTFWHARHLQAQADAAALAAAHEFQPCNNSNIYKSAGQYGGAATVINPSGSAVTSPSPLYNTQIGGTKQENMKLVINSKTYYPKPYSPGSTTHVDHTTVEKPPCEAAMVDVKLTETNLPWYVKVFKSAFNGVPYDNAHARVEILEQTSTAGAEPFVEPLPTPSTVTATLVDESNNDQPISEAIKLSSTNEINWSGTSATEVTFADPKKSGAINVGLRITLSTSADTTCGATGVKCYENDAAKSGVTFTRVWENSGQPGQPAAGEPEAPQAQDVTVVPTGPEPCPNAPNGTFSNFVSLESTAFPTGKCTIAVQAAKVVFAEGAGAPAINCTDVALKLNNVTLECPKEGSKEFSVLNGHTWVSKAVNVAANSGLTPLTLEWELMAGRKPKGATGGTNTKTCTAAKPCKGTLATQRINSGAENLVQAEEDEAKAGPIDAAMLNRAEPNGSNGPALQSVKRGEHMKLNIAVNVLGFENATTIPSVPPGPVALTFGGPQGNGAFACEGATGKNPHNLEKFIAEGCPEVYGTTEKEASVACAGAPTPPVCVKTNTGQKLDHVLDGGMNQRVNEGKKNTCVNPNHWTSPNTIAQILAESPPDPRLIITMITDNVPLGTGTKEVPIRAFATFYVTGWATEDPCLNISSGTSANGLKYVKDEKPTGPDAEGVLLGHFIKYVNVDDTKETGGGKCVVNSIGRCVAVLTR